VEIEGRVTRKRINVGSKSEHQAMVLVTKDGEFKLRRQGGHPFSDPDVQALHGKRIRAKGIIAAGQFLMETYEVIP
jgi:hypothetical protein